MTGTPPLAMLVSLVMPVLWASLAPAEERIQTPLEKASYARLTSHADMMAYLKVLDEKSDLLTMSIIGKSVQDREIPALFFSTDRTFGSRRDTKLVVLIYCQQHGNEPSGKEAALAFARELVQREKAVLNDLDLILVPQVNPDGSEANQRRNANNMDLNRNHAILSEPETQALHKLFLHWMPEATVDVHEFNASSRQWFNAAMVKDAEETIDCATNLNISLKLIRFSENVILPEVGRRIKEDGFRFSRYIVGGPPDARRIRHSTTDVNDGRTSMGIYNTLSFIFEGRRFDDVTAHIERRTAGQVSAIRSFLRTIAAHRSQIGDLVKSAREDMKRSFRKPERSAAIRMDYFPDPARKTLTYPVFDLNSWQPVERNLENYHPQPRRTQMIQTPVAYVVPKPDPRLVELLNQHQIQTRRLKKSTKVELEVYTIVKVTAITEEDKDAEAVEVREREKIVELEEGTLVIDLNQRAINLIPLLLEPQSSWSICTKRIGRKYRFADYLTEGKTYPIYRLMKTVKLDAE